MKSLGELFQTIPIHPRLCAAVTQHMGILVFLRLYKGTVIAMQIAAERLPTAFHVHRDSAGGTLRLRQLFGAIGFDFGTLLSFGLMLYPHAKVI